MVARLESRRHRFARHTRRQGQAIGDGLAQCVDIGLDGRRRRLEAQPRARAAQAGLDLVEDQHGAALVADASGGGEVPGARRDHTSFALHDLEDHTGGTVGVDGGVQRVDVVVGDLPEAGREGLEPRLFGRLPGGGEGGERAAVEAVVGRDDLELVGPSLVLTEPPHDLESALVRLGAGVPEEHAPPAGQRLQTLGQAHLRLGVIEIRRVDQRAHLLRHGVGDLLTAVPDGADGDASEEVEVLAAVVVEQAHAVAPHEHHWVARVCGQQRR